MAAQTLPTVAKKYLVKMKGVSIQKGRKRLLKAKE
jgi:hypothetical protein